MKLDHRLYLKAPGSPLLAPTLCMTLGPMSHPWEPLPSRATESFTETLALQSPGQTLGKAANLSKPQCPEKQWRIEAKRSSTEGGFEARWPGFECWLHHGVTMSKWLTFLCLGFPVSKSGIMRALSKQLLMLGVSRWLRGQVGGRLLTL